MDFEAEKTELYSAPKEKTNWQEILINMIGRSSPIDFAHPTNWTDVWRIA